MLALYLKLYDDTQAWVRGDVEAFKLAIEEKLGERMDVIRQPICRLEAEVREAVEAFREEKADAIVTVHLAYSPSLESYRALAEAGMPLLVLDTTPDESFSPVTGVGRVMQNHGIHGVQDLCSLLRRSGAPYQIFAGHYLQSDVLERVRQAAVGAMMASRMRNSRVGRVGEPFVGMGDFHLERRELEDLGVTVIPFDRQEGVRRLEQVSESEIDREWELDNQRYLAEDLPEESYRAAARVGLAIRRWTEQERLDGITVNFLATDHNPALPVMPFLELCKGMERGIGYAGEGDAMNAAFVASLMKGFPKTTFSEMFCPDWEGGAVFCSHMGEFNPLVADAPLILAGMEFPYTSAGDACALFGRFSGGERVAFLNLNPLGKDRFVLIAAPGSMRGVTEEAPEMRHTVRGWFAPGVPLARFLEEYSRLGGGHHGAIVYDPDFGALESFAHCMRWEFAVIQ